MTAPTADSRMSEVVAVVRQFLAGSVHKDNASVYSNDEWNTLAMRWVLRIEAPARDIAVETVEGVGNICEAEDHYGVHAPNQDCTDPREVPIVKHRIRQAVYPGVSCRDLLKPNVEIDPETGIPIFRG